MKRNLPIAPKNRFERLRLSLKRMLKVQCYQRTHSFNSHALQTFLSPDVGIPDARSCSFVRRITMRFFPVSSTKTYICLEIHWGSLRRWVRTCSTQYIWGRWNVQLSFWCTTIVHCLRPRPAWELAQYQRRYLYLFFDRVTTASWLCRYTIRSGVTAMNVVSEIPCS